MGAQFGLITYRQALACGLDRRAIARRARTRWEPFLPQVYRMRGCPSSWEQEACGATLWAGEGGALSFSAAARVWDLNGFRSAAVEISTSKPKRNVELPFKVHRVGKHLSNHIEQVRGLWVTSMRYTLLDLAGAKHCRAEFALDQALARQQVTLGQMSLLYEEQWTRGRRGIAILRTWLLQRTPGRGPDDSELEFLLAAAIRTFGLPEPERQVQIELPDRTIRVDVCYPDRRLVIEADSYAWHLNREAFGTDRKRDRQLQALGWRVLRFTWAELRWEAEEVARVIRAHLAPTGD